jgi:hypothetical protein
MDPGPKEKILRRGEGMRGMRGKLINDIASNHARYLSVFEA